MDWFKFCKDYFDWGIANAENLKIYVAKNKISSDQYLSITGVEYIAT